MSRYLDIDRVLSEEERVPCKFTYGAAGLAYLDPTLYLPADGALPAGSDIELPLWLATSLFLANHVDLGKPKHFGDKMYNEIMAGAEAINLREYSYYYFETGMELAKALHNVDMQNMLRLAFTGERYKRLMVRALANYKHDDLADYCQQLTAAEYTIFNEGFQAANDLMLWRSQQSKLQKAPILKRRSNNSSTSGSGDSSKRNRGSM